VRLSVRRCRDAVVFEGGRARAGALLEPDRWELG
jgi:hypothetical protein